MSGQPYFLVIGSPTSCNLIAPHPYIRGTTTVHCGTIVSELVLNRRPCRFWEFQNVKGYLQGEDLSNGQAYL
jgi:hypothetical protein